MADSLPENSETGILVQCAGCGRDITPRGGATVPHCADCERAVGWNDGFEKYQPVRVWPGWEPEEGGIDLAGRHGVIVGRCSTGAYDVALPMGNESSVSLFTFYDNEIEPLGERSV